MSSPIDTADVNLDFSTVEPSVDDGTPKLTRNFGCTNLKAFAESYLSTQEARTRQEVEDTCRKVEEQYQERMSTQDTWPGGHE